MNDISIEALKLRERELELDAVMIRGRVEEIRNIIAHMERRRGGRPRRVADGGSIAGGVGSPIVSMVNGQQGVSGGIAETDTQLFLEDVAQ